MIGRGCNWSECGVISDYIGVRSRIECGCEYKVNVVCCYGAVISVIVVSIKDDQLLSNLSMLELTLIP